MATVDGNGDNTTLVYVTHDGTKFEVHTQEDSDGVETVESRRGTGNNVHWDFINHSAKTIDIRLEFPYNGKKPLKKRGPITGETGTYQFVGCDQLKPTGPGSKAGRVWSKTKRNTFGGDETYGYKLKIREHPSGNWDEVDPQLEIDDGYGLMERLVLIAGTLLGFALGWFLSG